MEEVVAFFLWDNWIRLDSNSRTLGSSDDSNNNELKSISGSSCVSNVQIGRQIFHILITDWKLNYSYFLGAMAVTRIL